MFLMSICDLWYNRNVKEFTMNVKLKSFAFKGIKNIEEILEINFISKKKLKNEDLDTSFVTALYGPNGVGKSAFVEALNLYKAISLKKACLLRHAEYIKEYKNTNCNEIVLEAIFVAQSDKYKTAEEIKHTIVINEQLQIGYEAIERQSKVLKIINGDFENTNIVKKKVQNKYINLLIDSSFVALAFEEFKSDDADFGSFSDVLFNLLIGIIKIDIFIEDKDDNFTQLFFMKNKDKIGQDSLKNAIEINMKKQRNIIDIVSIPQADKEEFKEKWDKIGNFIKIAKPQVKGLEINFIDITEDTVRPNVFIDYGNYKINVHSESVGIQKLINIYNALSYLVNSSSILVIDEFDAHLHDVLVTEILKYIIANEVGQIIFTTHNILLMEELKNQKEAIQFLDLEGNVHVWSRNGNSSPEKAYLSGLLTDDFKYGIFDFEEVLMNE